jgi:hypothetical protein
MHATHTITASLAAVLATAALAAPATAVPADTHNQPNGWYAGKSTIQGSKHSDSSRDPATANVYVPPADLGLGDASTPAAAAPKSGDTPADYPGMTDTPGAGNVAVPAPTLTEASDTGGFDWGSAGIGAAAGIGAFAIALAGTAEMRRRRLTRRPSAISH